MSGGLSFQFITHHSALITCPSEPPHHRHARAAPDLGLDLELVHEALRAGQPLAEAAPRGEAVAHDGGDVGDAGAAVLEDETQALTARGVERLRDHAPAPP